MSFRLKGSPKRTTKLARQGLIEGGELHGCRYTFEGFSAIVARGVPRLRVHLIINRDGWPFPEAVVLCAAESRGLLPGKGVRSQWIDAAPLMKAALQPVG